MDHPATIVPGPDHPPEQPVSVGEIPARGVAEQLEAAARLHGGKSGFAVLRGNREAFTDRIALADFAEKTIDVQYYIWSADTAGSMLADHLVRAADRGVKVRFLLDDVNFKRRDSATATLGAHPNSEVRIFNPHRYRPWRLFEFGADFGRLNRRMHNKVIVMDNVCAIVGGRNIADLYFGLDEHSNNRDLDIAAVGPIVRQLSATFDEFWNGEASVTIETFARERPDMDAFRRQLATMRGNIRPERYPFPIEEDVASLRGRLDEIMRRMVWADGEDFSANTTRGRARTRRER
jgi:putative cardiolipin synthase